GGLIFAAANARSSRVPATNQRESCKWFSFLFYVGGLIFAAANARSSRVPATNQRESCKWFSFLFSLGGLIFAAANARSGFRGGNDYKYLNRFFSRRFCRFRGFLSVQICVI